MSKIFFAQKCATFTRGIRHFRRKFTGVERSAFCAPDQFKRARVVFEYNALRRKRRAPLRRENPLPLGELCHLRVTAGPQSRSARRNEIAITRKANRRLKQIRER